MLTGFILWADNKGHNNIKHSVWSGFSLLTLRHSALFRHCTSSIVRANPAYSDLYERMRRLPVIRMRGPYMPEDKLRWRIALCYLLLSSVRCLYVSVGFPYSLMAESDLDLLKLRSLGSKTLLVQYFLTNWESILSPYVLGNFRVYHMLMECWVHSLGAILMSTFNIPLFYCSIL